MAAVSPGTGFHQQSTPFSAVIETATFSPFSISSAINTLHRRMQARNTSLQFKWVHWQEILDKSDVSHMLVVPVCEDYWDWDQSIIRVLPGRVTATYLTIVTQSCRPVATISGYRHLQFSHRYTVSYTVSRKRHLPEPSPCWKYPSLPFHTFRIYENISW